MGLRTASTTYVAPLRLRFVRFRRPIITLAAATLILIFVAATVQMLMARRHLLAGSRNLTAAATAIRAPLTMRNASVRARVQSRLAQAEIEFAIASDDLRLWSPLLEHLGWLPGIGAKLAAASPATAAALHATNSALALMQGMSAVWPAMNPAAKDEPLLTRITVALQRGHAQFVRSVAEADRADTALRRVPANSGDATLDRAGARLRRDLPLLKQAGGWLTLAPDLLGASREGHFLFAWENPAEIRASGGFVGASTFFTVRAGRLSSAFAGRAPGHEVSSAQLPFPEAMYTFEMHWIFADSNWSPDFPLSARLQRWFYGEDTGRWADGVIDFVDTATPGILQAIGPVYVPAYHRWVDGGNVNQLAQRYVNGRYWGPLQHGDPDTLRKQFLNATLKAALQRVQSLPAARWPFLGAALARAISNHDVLLYSRQAAPQSLIRQAGADGGVLHTPGDFLYIVDDNRSYNKLNPYVRESARYDVRILPSLQLESTLTLHYHVNPSPANLEGYGPGYGLWGTKHDYQEFLRVYVPAGAVLERMSGLDRWAPQPAYGLTQFAGRFLLRAGHSLTVTIRYRTPGNALSALGSGHYRLTVQPQPGSELSSLNVTVRTARGVFLGSQARTPPSPFRTTLHFRAHRSIDLGISGSIHPQIDARPPVNGPPDPYIPFASLRDRAHPL